MSLEVSRDNYRLRMDWERQSSNLRGISFLAHFEASVSVSSGFLTFQDRDGSWFRFWLDEWLAWGTFQGKVLELFALAQSLQATVCNFQDNNWNP